MGKEAGEKRGVKGRRAEEGDGVGWKKAVMNNKWGIGSRKL